MLICPNKSDYKNHESLLYEVVSIFVIYYHVYAPIQKHDKSLRYGAFLMGYLVRALGGILYVKRPRARTVIGPLEFLIRVPLGHE